MAKSPYKKPRTAKRAFILYLYNTSLGWRMDPECGHVSFAMGEEKVRLGQWRRVYDGVSGAHLGYQPLRAPQRDRSVLPGIPVATTITEGEMDLNAGQCFADGKSLSVALRDELRRAGQRIGLPDADAVEEAAFKVKHYRQIGDDQAVRV
ncbi:MAG TPA: hypothetical protein VM554_15140 [Acidisarcina sp.]|nr:hypothetical protein [Acidisarcina sp.]